MTSDEIDRLIKIHEKRDDLGRVFTALTQLRDENERQQKIIARLEAAEKENKKFRTELVGLDAGLAMLDKALNTQQYAEASSLVVAFWHKTDRLIKETAAAKAVVASQATKEAGDEN